MPETCHPRLNYREYLPNLLFRLRSAPPDVRKLWDDLKRTGSATTKSKFVAAMLQASKTGFDHVKLVTTEETSTAKVEQDNAVWLSWTQIKEKEGEANVRVMLSAGTIQTRRHPKIPAESGVEWPEFLQFRYQETFLIRD